MTVRKGYLFGLHADCKGSIGKTGEEHRQLRTECSVYLSAEITAMRQNLFAYVSEMEITAGDHYEVEVIPVTRNFVMGTVTTGKGELAPILRRTKDRPLESAAGTF